MVKLCSICALEKSLDSFYKKKDKYEAQCKSCRMSSSKAYYSNNAEEHNKRCRTWKSLNPEKNKQINNDWEKKKRKEDKFWAAKKALRIRILQVLNGKNKSKNTLKIVGLNGWSDLKTHFEQQILLLKEENSHLKQVIETLLNR